MATSLVVLSFALTTTRAVNQYQAALRELQDLDYLLDNARSWCSRDLTEYYESSGVVKVIRDALHADVVIIPEAYGRNLARVTNYDERRSIPLKDLRAYLTAAKAETQTRCWRIDLSSLQLALTQATDASLSYMAPVRFRIDSDGAGTSLKLVAPNGAVLASGIKYTQSYSLPLTHQRAALRSSGVLDLPYLSRVWDEVATADVATAEALLRRKAAEAEKASDREVNLVGINVRERLIGILAPSTILLLLLYLYVHVAHIRAVATVEAPHEIRTFPWVALFPDVLSRVLTAVSLSLLPVIAGDSVIWRIGLREPVAISSVIAFSCMSGSAAIAILRQVSALRAIVPLPTEMEALPSKSIDQ